MSITFTIKLIKDPSLCYIIVVPWVVLLRRSDTTEDAAASVLTLVWQEKTNLS